METCGPNGAVQLVGGCFMLVIWLAMIILPAVLSCKIFSKAGYHWALGLIMLIPIGNLVMLCVLAFGQWPIHRELDALKTQTAASPPL
jgi:hypothetical protein